MPSGDLKNTFLSKLNLTKQDRSKSFWYLCTTRDDGGAVV